MRTKPTCQKKPMIIVRIIKTPIRALCKAKDLYVKGITNFSTTYSTPMKIMETNPTAQPLPRSFSTTILSNNHSCHQLPEGIIRANSTNTTRISTADLEMYMIQQHHHQQSRARSKRMPRSCSVGMERIDEDRASSFKDNNIPFKNKLTGY